MSDKIEIIIKPENEIDKQEAETLIKVLKKANITDNAMIMLKEMEQEQLKPLSTAMLHPILEDNEIKCMHGGVVQLKFNLGKSIQDKNMPFILETDLLYSSIKRIKSENFS